MLIKDATHDAAGVLHHEQYRAVRHFPALDGLRGLAVLMVVAYHCPRLAVPGVEQLQLAGDAGVDVFFVLSGFLITLLLLRDRAAQVATAPALLRRFFTKRVLRIVPLYTAAVVLYWMASQVSNTPDAAARYDAALPYLLTYTIDAWLGWADVPFPMFGIAWSLGVEEKFYLFWPLVVLMMRPRKVLIAALVVIAGIILWRAWLVNTYTGDLTARLYYPFDMRIDGIMWGCVLACLLHDPALYQATVRLLRRRLAPIVIAAVTAVTVAVLLENDSFARYLLLPASVAVVLGVAVVQPEHALLRPMRWQPLCIVGRISYGVYVLHPLAIMVVGRVIGDETLAQRLAVMAAATVLTGAAAAASYRWFELPIMRHGRRLMTIAHPTPVTA